MDSTCNGRPRLDNGSGPELAVREMQRTSPSPGTEGTEETAHCSKEWRVESNSHDIETQLVSSLEQHCVSSDAIDSSSLSGKSLWRRVTAGLGPVDTWESVDLAASGPQTLIPATVTTQHLAPHAQLLDAAASDCHAREAPDPLYRKQDMAEIESVLGVSDTTPDATTMPEVVTGLDGSLVPVSGDASRVVLQVPAGSAFDTNAHEQPAVVTAEQQDLSPATVATSPLCSLTSDTEPTQGSSCQGLEHPESSAMDSGYFRVEQGTEVCDGTVTGFVAYNQVSTESQPCAAETSDSEVYDVQPGSDAFLGGIQDSSDSETGLCSPSPADTVSVKTEQVTSCEVSLHHSFATPAAADVSVGTGRESSSSEASRYHPAATSAAAVPVSLPADSERQLISVPDIHRLLNQLLAPVSVSSHASLVHQLCERICELAVRRDAAEERGQRLQADCDSLANRQEIERRRYQDTVTGLRAELDTVKAQLNTALRDKDKMVIRYAHSEKAVLDAKREAAAADKSVKDVVREKELMASKMKYLAQEKEKLSQILDAKVNECSALLREIRKLKEELVSRDVKIKWLQNKLKQETESHAQMQVRMESLLGELQQSEQTVRKYQQLEESWSSAQDRERREERTRQLVEEKLRQDCTQKEQILTSQLQAVQQQISVQTEQLQTTTAQLQAAEQALQQSETTVSQLQEELEAVGQQLEPLQRDSGRLTEVSAQLEERTHAAELAQSDVQRLQMTCAELEVELDACHSREANLLELTQRLTEREAQVRSQMSAAEARCSAAVAESELATGRLSTAETQLAQLSGRLAEEQAARQADSQSQARRLAELTRDLEAASRRADDAENNVLILERKHKASLKELYRELGGGRRPVLEGRSGSDQQLATGNQSRASSSTASLHEAEQQQQQPEQPLLPDTQVLIERIVRLQRQLARRNERLDLLQAELERVSGELRQKSRLLQHYLIREEAGALASQHTDQAKARLLRKGGIMASVYGSQPMDEAMTLELSLEINKRLQQVLEDTLLKNMTLKDNMSVLGQEIQKLTEENKVLRGD